MEGFIDHLQLFTYFACVDIMHVLIQRGKNQVEPNIKKQAKQ
jgi:hypothetical protein